MKEKDQLSVTYPSSSFWCSLVDGVKWVKKALELTIVPFNQRCNLSDAEEVLEESKVYILYPFSVSLITHYVYEASLVQLKFWFPLPHFMLLFMNNEIIFTVLSV